MYSLFTPKFRYELTEKVKNYKKPLEIEARLRDLTPDNIETLRTYLQANNDGTGKEFTVDYYVGNRRITQRNDAYFSITKKSITIPPNATSDDRDIKISVAEESEEKPASPPSKYKLKRVKDRTYYLQGNFRFDLTLVNNEKTEVEIEVIDSRKFDVVTFEEKINSVYDLFQNSDYQAIKKFLVDKMLYRKEGDFYKEVNRNISKARTLLFNDMTKDGLLDFYAIAPKADGEQKIMIFYKYKVWLFWPYQNDDEKSFTLLGQYDNQDWHNTIITGEWVSKENHSYKEAYIYLPFDCLICQGKDMRKRNYIQRFKKLFPFYDTLISNTLILKKEIVTYENNIEDFYRATNEAILNLKKIKYINDGLIFTPIHSPYVTEGQRNARDKNRTLANYKDVCKFKRPDQLTNDFLVKADGLYTSNGKFEGTNSFPFSAENYEVKGKEYMNQIVEFAPKDIQGKIVYTPVRIRTEKDFPNSRKVVTDNWVLSHNPITVNTITGKDNKLQHRYHNDIKRELISNLQGYVVDIGSGKGGDLPKYMSNRQIKSILAIEPNQEFMTELERRLSNMKNTIPIETLLSGGEATNTILESAKSFFPENFGKENINICFNISLSFFWKDDKMLMALAETIKKLEEFYYARQGEGKVIISYLTIEGNRLNQLFQKKGEEIKLNTVTLRKMDEHQVYVDISSGKTVHDQTEYLVYLQKLWQLTSFYPLFEYDANNASKKGFMLSENELIYSKLFVYGYAERKQVSEYIYQQNHITKCLPVNEKKAQKTEFGLRAKGDDERISLDSHHYRLATMNTPHKLYHAILKLIDSKYIKADVFHRHAMAKELQAKLRNSLDLKYISQAIDYGIKLYGQDKIIGNDKQYIVLYQCDDGLYEPVIFHDDTDHSIFYH